MFGLWAFFWSISRNDTTSRICAKSLPFRFHILGHNFNNSNSKAERVIVYDGTPRLIRTISKKWAKRANLSVDQKPNPRMCDTSESTEMGDHVRIYPHRSNTTVFFNPQ